MLHGRAIMSVAGGASGFSWSSVPDQLLRLDPSDPSTTESGGLLTGLSDLSGNALVITISGSPTYTAIDAQFNGQASWSGGHVRALAHPGNVLRYAVHVGYRVDSASHYAWWQGSGAEPTRYFGYTAGNVLLGPGGNAYPHGLGTAAGVYICEGGYDGATPITLYGGSVAHTPSNALYNLTGMNVGSSYIPSFPMKTGFFMSCSSVPDAGTRTAIIDELVARFLP